MPDPFWTDDTVTIWQADARQLPLDDESVDLVVTSPPYFGLRSYTDGGEHYAGQIGDEATPAEFLDALLDVTRECVRVLKPTGSLWVNLGDKYAERAGPVRPGGVDDDPIVRRPATRPARGRRDVPVKSLMMLPARYAIAAVDELRLILRAEVIWSKPNGLPESVTDRVRRSHEQWFHLVKRPRYFSAVDAIREDYAASTAASYANGRGAARIGGSVERHPSYVGREHTSAMPDDYAGNPLGKLPGSVWTIATQPLKVPAELGVDHFAAFPLEWPRRIIAGWSPSGICLECGEGRRPVAVSTTVSGEAQRPAIAAGRKLGGHHGQAGSTLGPRGVLAHIVGEACACDAPTAPTRPAVVLDPFGGTGTTGLAARALGRRAHLVDLSADYCRLAAWRVTDPGELARAMRVEKPPPPPEGVPSLLDLLNDEGVTA